MLLAVDIGNSAIKLGYFDAGILKEKFTFKTEDVATLGDHLSGNIDAAIVSSVVPKLNAAVADAVQSKSGIDASFVENTWDIGLKILYTPIEDAGSDRLVNCSAASKLYGTPCIVVSFGTATTIDVVDAEKTLIGGLIAPGIRMTARALHEKTARLPLVDIPETVKPVNLTTEASIQAGVIFAQIGLLETFIERLEKPLADAKVIATGGYAAMVSRHCDCIDVVDDDLLLKGLDLIYSERN